MIDVKIDKGVSTMTFAGSGLEIAAEICMMVHGLYTQLYHRAGPAVAKGCKETLRVMLAREDSLVWDVDLSKNAGHSFFLKDDAAAAMTERLTAYRQKDGLNSLAPLAAACGKVEEKVISAELLARMLNRERFPVAIWREVAAALDRVERKKGADADGKHN